MIVREYITISLTLINEITRATVDISCVVKPHEMNDDIIIRLSAIRRFGLFDSFGYLFLDVPATRVEDYIKCPIRQFRGLEGLATLQGPCKSRSRSCAFPK